MMSREVKLRSPIVSFESATLHRRHHLEPCTVEKFCGPVRTGQHGVVYCNCDAPVREPQRLEQRGDRGVLVDLDLLLIDHDDHWRTPTGTSSETICSAVHGASRKPDRPWP